MWISMQQVLTEYYLLHQSSVWTFVSYISQALSWECLTVSSGYPEKACLICCSSCMPVFCSFAVFSLVLKQASVHVCPGILIWCKMSPNLMATTEQILESNGVFGIDCANRKAKENKLKKAQNWKGHLWLSDAFSIFHLHLVCSIEGFSNVAEDIRGGSLHWCGGQFDFPSLLYSPTSFWST